MEEELFLGLRKREGVSYALFFEKFNQSLDEVFGNVIEELVARKVACERYATYRLNASRLSTWEQCFSAFLLDK